MKIFVPDVSKYAHHTSNAIVVAEGMLSQKEGYGIKIGTRITLYDDKNNYTVTRPVENITPYRFDRKGRVLHTVRLAKENTWVRMEMCSDPTSPCEIDPSQIQVSRIPKDSIKAEMLTTNKVTRGSIDENIAALPLQFSKLVAKAQVEALKTSKKFPQPNYTLLKIAEEAGEVIRGGVHYAEGRMNWSEVEGEIVQLLAMLIRFVTEGDQRNGITPPSKQGADCAYPHIPTENLFVALSPSEKKMFDKLKLNAEYGKVVPTPNIPFFIPINEDYGYVNIAKDIESDIRKAVGLPLELMKSWEIGGFDIGKLHHKILDFLEYLCGDCYIVTGVYFPDRFTMKVTYSDAKGDKTTTSVHCEHGFIPDSLYETRKYKLGDTLTKKRGSNWTGKVVGFYTTGLTQIGYAVESLTEKGSVQIYPESALKLFAPGKE